MPFERERTSGRRLVWIHQNFITRGEAGNRRAVHQVEAFLEGGWCVDVITAAETYLGDDARQGSPLHSEGTLRIHRLRVLSGRASPAARRRSYISFVLQAARYQRRFRHVDVVFCSSPPLPQVVPSLLTSVRNRCPLVLEVRDLWPAFLVSGRLLRSRLLRGAMQMVEAVAYHYAAHCVVTSPGFAPYVEAMGIPRHRYTIAPTGPDPMVAEADPELGRRWRLEHGLEDCLLVLYAGSFNEAYGVDLLVEAAGRSRYELPQVIWLFAGNGRHRRLVEQAALELPNVRYLGSLPKEDLVPALLGADAGINTHAAWPLLDTTLTGKLFDYLAAGLPVISVRGEQTRLVLEAAESGWTLESPTAPAFVAALRRLVALPPEERRAMGQRGRRWVLSGLSATAMARKVAAVVAEAALAPGDRDARRRIARAIAGGLGDVWNRRSSRAVEALYGDRRAETVAAAFADWSREQGALRLVANSGDASGRRRG